jgi:hypothetical protein
MRRWSENEFKIGFGILASGWLAIAPMGQAVGQEANFGTLTLSAARPAGTVTGSTGGSTSLPAIINNSDRYNQKCLGFGDPTPDHLLVLQQPMAQLRLSVTSSGGADTTLVVVGPGGIRCGGNSLTTDDWQPGTYRVWIGTTSPGLRRNYRFTATP